MEIVDKVRGNIELLRKIFRESAVLTHQKKSFSQLKAERYFELLRPGTYADIEPKIRPLCDAINTLPYAGTTDSCEGHEPPDITICAYVTMYVDWERGKHFVEWLMNQSERLDMNVEIDDPEEKVVEACKDKLVLVTLVFPKTYWGASIPPSPATRKDISELTTLIKRRVWEGNESVVSYIVR